jgi:hypothetical protein
MKKLPPGGVIKMSLNADTKAFHKSVKKMTDITINIPNKEVSEETITDNLKLIEKIKKKIEKHQNKNTQQFEINLKSTIKDVKLYHELISRRHLDFAICTIIVNFEKAIYRCRIMLQRVKKIQNYEYQEL